MNFKKVSALVLLCLATAIHAHAVDFVCFGSQEDCKEKGPFLNVEWIMVVQNVGHGQIAIWFDGMPGFQGGIRQLQVNWDHFLRHVIQQQSFKKFADFYITILWAYSRLPLDQ